ncbi:MAG: RHS repeat-associated core domain-containing protein, partial [Candidatus Melainabacteria bacterium]|nr:RHS repeat-associated core domain-containing protein [Candidatus Melainabacteria bacterium]
STVVYNESTEGFAHARRKRRKLARQRSRRTTSGACRPRKIDYPGANNYSQFSYDGLGQNRKIVETISGSLASTKQFILCNQSRCEQRDAVSAISAQFFTLGEQISGTSYFFTADHLANDPNHASMFGQLNVGAVVFSPLFTSSIHEMTNNAGSVQSQLQYDPFGRVVRLQGGLLPDFQFGDYYYHSSSGLNLTTTRGYSSSLGRFLSRDTIGEEGGINLFAYMDNHPINGVDPEGTCATAIGGGAVVGGAIAITAITMMAMSSGGSGSRPKFKMLLDFCPDPDCDPPFPPAPGSQVRSLLSCWNWCRDHCSPFSPKKASCMWQCTTHQW